MNNRGGLTWTSCEVDVCNAHAGRGFDYHCALPRLARSRARLTAGRPPWFTLSREAASQTAVSHGCLPSTSLRRARLISDLTLPLVRSRACALAQITETPSARSASTAPPTTPAHPPTRRWSATAPTASLSSAGASGAIATPPPPRSFPPSPRSETVTKTTVQGGIAGVIHPSFLLSVG